MKHKIDNEIDVILRKRFFFYKKRKTFHSCEMINDYLLHNGLCGVFFKTEYSLLWEKYWREINNRKYLDLSMYLGSREEIPYFEGKAVLLRLLVVEDFKKYCKKRLTK